MYVLVSTFEKMTMLMLNLSHDFHSAPFVHFICQLLLVDKIISVAFFILKRVFIKLSSDGLSTYVGSDSRFVVDKSFNNWNDVGVLCTNIDHQTTLQGEKICWENGGFVHEETIELIRLIEELNELLSVLFTAQRWLNIKERVFWGIYEHFFTQCKSIQCLESFPIFNKTVLEYCLWISVFLGKGRVEIHFSLFRSISICLHIWRYNSVGSLFTSESHFSVEGSNFHNQGNSILMIKTWRDIHY